MPGSGFDTVIEALPTVPDAEFVIVGGPEAQRVAAPIPRWAGCGDWPLSWA